MAQMALLRADIKIEIERPLFLPFLPKSIHSSQWTIGRREHHAAERPVRELHKFLTAASLIEI